MKQHHKKLSTLFYIFLLPKDKYIDEVKEFGNMVSASVPITLAHSLEKQKIKNNDIILLMGTAAGLTTNMMLIKI